MTACTVALTASVITYNIVFNHAGPKDVTKQHFCKILNLKKNSISGTLGRNWQSSLRAQILLLHSLTHSEGQHSSLISPKRQ